MGATRSARKLWLQTQTVTPYTCYVIQFESHRENYFLYEALCQRNGTNVQQRGHARYQLGVLRAGMRGRRGDACQAAWRWSTEQRRGILRLFDVYYEYSARRASSLFFLTPRCLPRRATASGMVPPELTPTFGAAGRCAQIQRQPWASWAVAVMQPSRITGQLHSGVHQRASDAGDRRSPLCFAWGTKRGLVG